LCVEGELEGGERSAQLCRENAQVIPPLIHTIVISVVHPQRSLSNLIFEIIPNSDQFRIKPLKSVFRIRIRPDPKLLGLKDLDPNLLISDPDPPLFHRKLKNMF